MSEYRLKPGKIGEKVVNAYKGVEDKFKDAFLEEDKSSDSGYTLKTGKMADTAVEAYKKIEDTVVGGYKKIEDKFVDAFLEKVDPKEEEEK